MAGDAVGGDREAEHPLLRAAHAVAAPPRVLEQRASTLVDQQIAAQLLGVRPGQPLRAQRASRLLVHDRRDQQLTRGGAPARARQRGRRGDLRGHLGLHVERAPPPDEALGEVAGPGIVRPLGGVGEHGVEVAEVAQGRARGRRAVRAQPRQQVRPRGLGAEQLALEARLAQVRGEVFARGELVAGRVDGIDADQLAQQLLRLCRRLGDGRLGAHARLMRSSCAAHAAVAAALIAQIVRPSPLPPRG